MSEPTVFKRKSDDKIIALEQGDEAIMLRISQIIEEKKKLEEEEKTLKEAIQRLMEKHAVMEWDNDYFIAKYVSATTSKRFNSKKFKDDHPKMYENYIEETDRSAYVTIKAK